VAFINHPDEVPSLGKSTAMPLLPLCAFMVCYGETIIIVVIIIIIIIIATTIIIHIPYFAAI